MTNAKTTYKRITTFMGRDEGAVLILDPIFPAYDPKQGVLNSLLTPDPRTHLNAYQTDAEAVAQFLKGVFCIATLQELRKLLPGEDRQ